MKIICTNSEDYKLALAFSDIAGVVGVQANVICRHDAYALTMWSIDEVAELKDERAKNMSEDEKDKFMEFAQKQLLEDITERGRNLLMVLLDEYFNCRVLDESQYCKDEYTAIFEGKAEHNIKPDKMNLIIEIEEGIVTSVYTDSYQDFMVRIKDGDDKHDDVRSENYSELEKIISSGFLRDILYS